MSHTDGKAPVNCLNCGHPTTLNYCAQCGQKTHLHQDTFLGLIWHFLGHYFHYDSKFWKTLKALWFAPGKLTREYWEGKRARSISPVSLYIFISAVFFIIMVLGINMEQKHVAVSVQQAHNVAIDTQELRRPTNVLKQKGTVLRRAGEKLKRLETGTDQDAIHFLQEFLHQMPKLFFFMIPVMAAMLKLLFLRRKGMYFVHHAIFSLHLHAYFFSIFLIKMLNPFERIDDALGIFIAAVYAIYFVVAMRRAYSIGYGRAIAATLFIGLSYVVFFAIALIGMLVYIIE